MADIYKICFHRETSLLKEWCENGIHYRRELLKGSIRVYLRGGNHSDIGRFTCVETESGSGGHYSHHGIVG